MDDHTPHHHQIHSHHGNVFEFPPIEPQRLRRVSLAQIESERALAAIVKPWKLAHHLWDDRNSDRSDPERMRK